MASGVFSIIASPMASGVFSIIASPVGVAVAAGAQAASNSARTTVRPLNVRVIGTPFEPG